MSYNSSSTDIPMVVTNDTDISVSQAPWMLPFLSCFVVPPKKFNCGIFTTKFGFPESSISSVNSTTAWWSGTLVASIGFAYKDLYADLLSTSFSFNNYVALLYRESISHTYIIFDGRWYIKIDIETIQLAICVPHVVH